MPDRTLTCIECGKEFIYTDNEQQFYKKRDFQEPKRCSICRNARKKKRPDFNGGGGGGGGGGGFKGENKGRSRW